MHKILIHTIMDIRKVIADTCDQVAKGIRDAENLIKKHSYICMEGEAEIDITITDARVNGTEGTFPTVSVRGIKMRGIPGCGLAFAGDVDKV